MDIMDINPRNTSLLNFSDKINDLHKAIQYCGLHHFADDSQK